ncbi:FecR family protein [Pedobacter nyackensis]|uniref:FecR family protein n=1 Tax=Pedobacter nyackensis TaxID=475255 RepID=UPI00292F07BD|nr:FecR domain-containing protein [Pedobacter nyackensis]
MPQNLSNIESLFRKYSADEASEVEIQEMFQLIAAGGHDSELLKLLQTEMEMSDVDGEVEVARRDKVREKIREVIGILDGHPAVPAKKKSYRWLAAAAAIIIVCAVAVLFSRSGSDDTNLAMAAKEIAPGKSGATLTLADGRKIRLADVAKGELAQESGMEIVKMADGKIIYNVKGEVDAIGKTNTLATARGETYEVCLPDGSLVWLNAASSLTYSATLNERGVRRVRLEGEACFQIKKDKSHPFVVETKSQQVQVLGTHFNVNAYPEERDVRTTLLEGSVKVTISEDSQQSKVLVPGQQARVDGGELNVLSVNTAEVTAWKNGFFEFKRVPLNVIMRDLSRWYDIDIEYADNASREVVMSGYVARSRNISVILERMQATGGVHFRIEGKKVFVYKEN